MNIASRISVLCLLICLGRDAAAAPVGGGYSSSPGVQTGQSFVGPQGVQGPSAQMQLPLGTVLADPTVIDPVYTGYVPVSANGDFEIGVTVVVTQPGLVALGARQGWVAGLGTFDSRLWRYASSGVVASALAVAAPVSTGIVQVSYSTPVVLAAGEAYVVSTHDTANVSYVKGGVAGAEGITDSYLTHVGIFYPGGIGRRYYSAGHSPHTIPNLDDGAASIQSIVVAPMSQVTSVYNGQTGVDLYKPVEWSTVPQATAYAVQVGTTAGGLDVYYESGILPVGRMLRHLPGLSPSTTYYVTISTQFTGTGASIFPSNSTVAFTTAASDTGIPFTSTDPTKVALASTITDRVRSMADFNGLPTGGTVLWDITSQRGRTYSSCYDFASAWIEEAMSARLKAVNQGPIGFINNGTEVHQIAWAADTAQGGAPVTFDPTFDLSYMVGGQLASAAQMHTALVGNALSTVSFRLWGTAGRKYGLLYYLDYPTLYLLNPASATYIDPTPYLSASLGASTTAPVPATIHTPNGGGNYIVSGGTTGAGQVTVGGVPQATTNDAHGFSGVFYVGPGVVASITSGGGVLKTPLRYVFQ